MFSPRESRRCFRVAADSKSHGQLCRYATTKSTRDGWAYREIVNFPDGPVLC